MKKLRLIILGLILLTIKWFCPEIKVVRGQLINRKMLENQIIYL